MSTRQRHVTGVITLDASAQNIAEELGLPTGVPVRDLSLQHGVDNSNPFYVGHDATVSATVYGTRVPPPSVTQAPYLRDGFDDGTMKLGEWYVFGTNGETVHVDVCLDEDRSV